jgi:hypothetical protein
MTKPVYRYPDFIASISLEKTDSKRYWLKLIFDESKKETVAVVLKNPSRANKEISDKTVYNVSSYIYRNRYKYSEFKDVGTIVILNLIPYYQTYSDQLEPLKNEIIDPENLSVIKRFTSQCKNVIIAYGNHPKGLFSEYETLKKGIMNVLSENNNKVLYVDKMSLAGNPKHGQVWGYKDPLRILNIYLCQ